MNDTDQLLATLRKEYLDEATFLLDQCEELLLGLETSDRKELVLAELFRAAHTIKGSGAAVGFEELVRFAHVAEDCLVLLRVDPDLGTTDIVSLLLRSVDALKFRLTQLKTGSPGEWDVSGLTLELQNTISSITKTDKKPPDPAPLVIDDSNLPSGGFGFFDDEPAKPAPKVKEPPKSPPATDSGKTQASSIKVDAYRIDSVLDMVGELVVAKSQLLNRLEIYSSDAQLQSIAALVDTIVRDLQDRALSIRLMPLKPMFMKMQRMVRDLSLQVNKKIDIVISGEDTEIDRTMVEALADPLMHMMRNSIDHGIETAERRRDAGKKPTGLITLTARQAGGRVIIEVRDDGGGIPRAAVIKKALEKGLVSDPETASRLTDKDIYALILQPGFSTAAAVSDLSGRGVGMDVVKTNIERLSGTIDVDSIEGTGTTFTLSLPVTTSITDGIQVTVGGQAFIIPMDCIRELIAVADVAVSGEDLDIPSVCVRSRFVPIIDLAEVLATRGILKEEYSRNTQSPTGHDDRMVVVVETGNVSAALLVDEVVGQLQVVLKPLDSELVNSGSLAGAAIMGDGKVALVLDIQSIIQAAAMTFGRRDTGPKRKAA